MASGTYDLDEFRNLRNKRGLGDFHLRSALLLVDWESLKVGKGRFREQRAASHIMKVTKRINVEPAYPIDLFSTLLYEIVEPSPMPRKEALHELLSVEFDALNKILKKGGLFKKALDFLDHMDLRRPEFTIKKQLTIGLMHLMAITSEREVGKSNLISYDKLMCCPVLNIGYVSIYLFGEIIGYRSLGNRTLNILSLDSYRMIVDKFTERSNVIIAAEIGSKILPDIYPSVATIDQVFINFDGYLRLKGNSGYKLLKTFEALITGIILKRNISLYWDCDEFWKNTIIDFDDLERTITEDLLEICTRPGTTVHHLTQIMGLFRLWGHPVVDAKKGVEKVRLVGKAEKNISEYTSLIAGLKFLEIIFINFFNKNGYYPEHMINPNAEETYLASTLSSEIIINVKDPSYHILQWRDVTVLKTFDIPSSFNLSMIVADTAISPTRSEILESSKKGTGSMDPSIRRGVLKWMRDGVLDCPSLLESVNENEMGLPIDHRIIGLYQKEREINPVARMFALMSLLMRAYVVVTEAMLSDHILPLIPGITMTYSMLDLTKEMIKTTWRQKNDDPNSVTFCINMDFEKWNLNMRKEATHKVFEYLGDLFGYKHLYNRTYDIFENSIIYLADGSYSLNLNEDLSLNEHDENLAYGDHKGGFEGLRQKGWTIFTVVLISTCCNKLNIDWKLMGQGDNQVLLATIHSSYARREGISSPSSINEIKSKLQDLLTELIDTFGSVGLPLKPLETWVSDSFFSYGKFPIFRGLPCAMSLKKISRVFYFSNEDIMTLDNAMGSVTSNAQSAAMGDVLPVVPYIIAKWQQLLCVELFTEYHPLLGKSPINGRDIIFKMRTDEGKHHFYMTTLKVQKKYYLFALVSFPKTMGGLNCLTYFNMIMRGFPDPANMDYQWLSCMKESATGEFRELLENLSCLMLNPEKNYSYLLQDPVGLNLFVPKNSTQTIKQMIHRVIENLPYESQFSNWFKEVMKISDPKEIESLANDLTDQKVLNVRFLHDLLGSTIFGYSDSITSKVDKTVTLSRLALNQEDVVGQVMKAEQRFINYLFWRISVKGNFESNSKCASAYVREARNVGWDRQLEGVSVPFPYEYLSDDVNESNRADSYLLGTVDDNCLVTNSYTLNNVGHALPYLGSVTMEKLPISPVRLAYGTEPLISRPIRLLRAVGWFVLEGSNFHNLIKDMIEAVTDIETDQMTMIPERVKGSMIHRYSDFATKHGSLWLSLYGPATFMNLSTNNFHEFSRGSKNVTLHFQATLCLIQFIMVSNVLSDNKRKIFRFWRSCESCITKINDEFIDLEKPVSVDLIPSRKENPYLYLSKEKINLQQKRIEVRLRMVKRSSLYDISKDDLHNSLSEWLGLRIACSIVFKNDAGSEGSLLDISGISRTFFLKVDPSKVLEAIGRSLHILISMGEKYKNKFPNFKITQKDIIRTSERSGSGNFSLFGGYYLWPESLKRLRSIGSSFPETYPATPQSIADACKRTIINHLYSMRKVGYLDSGVLFFNYETQLNYLLKFSSIRRLSQKGRCIYCLHSVLTTKYNFSEVDSPILMEKCPVGHCYVNLEDINSVKYLPDVNMDSVTDLLDSLGESNGGPERVISINLENFSQGDQCGLIILDQENIGDSGSSRINTYIKVNLATSPLDQTIDQLFNHPTRAFYRVIELLSSSPSFKKGNFLIMGDGYGLSSLAASSVKTDECKIVSWSYIEHSSGLSHSLQDSLPPVCYNFENNIDVSPTFYEVGDVGNPHFRAGFLKVIRENLIDQLYSDIEWWYVGLDHSCKLIELCHEASVKRVALRVYTNSLDDVLRILETAHLHYHEWKIIETKNINRSRTELLLIMEGIRLRKTETFYIDERNVRELNRLIYSNDFISQEDYKRNGDKLIKFIDHCLLNNQYWMKWINNNCSNWFNEAEVSGWLSDNFTTMLNSIRTGRRPQKVADLTGQDIYYAREKWEIKLRDRLLSLALSLTRETYCWVDCLRSNWDLIWKIDKHEEYRGVRVYNIIIQRNNVRNNIVKQHMIRVGHYSGMIRAIRMSKGLDNTFESLGQEITFRFCPKSEYKNRKFGEVFFLISKNASYGTEGLIL
ncbi:TPA_asm: L [Tagetes erecta virus 1]|uniref:RNA-directed RNA polymerase n=1 Tax=Tagetes erecta virus 1 TaxID=2793742 RepID=A0A8D9UJ50_9RHAB|nr:L [Tagetes erecta virus 1] [Tagetes erecta virus 1]DAF42350.1 TPA_asm: L [Tagetes erecta virus 1]